MESPSMLSVLARRWYVVLLATIVAVGAAWQVFERLPVRYTATTTLRVYPVPVDGVELPYRLDFADRFMNSLATLAESDWMLEELLASLNVEGDLRIVSEIPANTDLLWLSAIHTNPQAAAVAANEVGRRIAELSTLPGALSEVRTSDDVAYVAATTGTLALGVFHVASTPTEPSSLSLVETLLIAGGLGLLGGTAVAFASVGGKRPT